MTGNDLIELIRKTNLGDCDISVNFSFKGNGAFLAEIKDVHIECDDQNLFIDIGQIDDLIISENKELILEIKDDMYSWYAFNLTDQQIIEYLRENPIKYFFDTVEREDYADYLAKKITELSYPNNGDTQEYKDNFYKQLEIKSIDFGYIWNK